MANRGVPIAIVLAVGFLTASQVCAQTTREEEIEQQKAEKAARVQPQGRDEGDVMLDALERIFTPGPPAVELSFGGFRPGAGLSPGVAYVKPVGASALWTTRAAESFENFKLAESTLDIPTLARNRVDVRAVVRWEDAPRLGFFGLGAGTPAGAEVIYGLRTSEVGANADVRPLRWLRFGGGLQYLNVASENGAGPFPSVDSALTTVSAPGLGASPTWLHSATYIAIDNRESEGYTRRGGLYQVAFHDYSDRGDRYSFNRTEIDLRQFIPLVHDNWIVALQARADLMSAAAGQVIPFFMLPYLGGGDTLRGFSQYRFTDHNSLQLRGELRWTPSSVLDMAVFADQGTVAPSWQDLQLRGLKSGWGLGARLHGATFTALRLEVARSSEGWRYHISQSVSF